jgi:hypothetical protein
MFQRQWFSSSSQIGLTEPALRMRNLVKQHKFYEGAALVKSQFPNHVGYWRRQYKRLLFLQQRLVLEENEGLQPIRVYFSSFWPGMNSSCCQLLDFLQASSPAREVVSVASPNDADISIFSCYDNLVGLNDSEHCLRILFLGENVRPSYEHFDISLSSDQSTYCGLNCYLPLWLLEIDWFGKTYDDRFPYPLSLFTSDRIIDNTNKCERIAYVGNNYEPFRTSLINILTNNGFVVDLYGSQSRPVYNKIALYQGYHHVLCPENSFFPGYVTEKIIHSFVAGTIGIYWGCLDSQPFAQHEMILQLSSATPERDIIAKVSKSIKELQKNKGQLIYPRLCSEAALRSSYLSVISFLSEELKQFIKH